jgi:hypothetical protein
MRIILIAVLLLLVSACSPRTKFATHPKASAVFVPASSDAQAVEIADKVVAALGGPDAWKNAKQIRWKQEVQQDGATKLAGLHAWDRWNGRHYAKLLTGNKVEVMYPLYEDGGTAMVGRNKLDADSKNKAIASARKRWHEDTVLFLLPNLLKSPGVTLKYKGEAPGENGVDMTCHDLQVNFDGNDSTREGTTYHLIVDKESNMPLRIEIERGGPDKRLAYSFGEWTESGGVKLATMRQNLGYKAEVIRFSDVEVAADPDESLYTPQVY